MISGRTFFTTKRRFSKKAKANAPEVILRKMCTFHEKQGKSYPIPELLILANREGFRWLSKFFARCARKTGETEPPFGDPDDHEHIDLGDPEINPIHSDELAFRLGILTQKNRRVVFKKYRAHPAQAFPRRLGEPVSTRDHHGPVAVAMDVEA